MSPTDLLPPMLVVDDAAPARPQLMDLCDAVEPAPPLQAVTQPVSLGSAASVGEAVCLPDLSAFRDRVAGLVAALVHDEDDDEADTGPVPGQAVLPSAELRAVTKRISAQYVDVLARAAARLLSGDSADQARSQLIGSLQNLSRLATASGDVRHLALLTELQEAVEVWHKRAASGRGEAAFRTTLHRWLHGYAKFLDTDQSRAIRRLMGADADELPLLRRLAALRGIGPRRLERLYAAGLHDVERLAEAEPNEVTSVTGLPHNLADLVVMEAATHRRRQREALLSDMAERILAFAEEARRLRASPTPDQEHAIAAASKAMAAALAELEGVA